MPWYRERFNEDNPNHPPVFFHRREDFWRWRNQERPFDIEAWVEIGEERARGFEGQGLAPIPGVNINDGVKLREGINELNLGHQPPGQVFNWDNDIRPAVPPDPHPMAVPFVGLGPEAYNVYKEKYEPPKERDWDDLTTDEKLEWLLEQPDSLPIWREVVERIAYLNECIRDEKDNARHQWDEGYDEARREFERDDD